MKVPHDTLCCSPRDGHGSLWDLHHRPHRENAQRRAVARSPGRRVDFWERAHSTSGVSFVPKATDVLLSTKAAMIHSAKDNIWFSIIFNVNGVLPLSDPPLTLLEPDCHPAGMGEQSPPGSTAGPETLSVFNTSTGGKAVAPPPGKYFTALNKMHIQEERLKELPAAPNHKRRE